MAHGNFPICKARCVVEIFIKALKIIIYYAEKTFSFRKFSYDYKISLITEVSSSVVRTGYINEILIYLTGVNLLLR